MSQEEERRFYFYSAVGWTATAILYTAYAFWRGDPRKHDSALLGWLIAAWSWGYWLYERRKANRSAQKERP